MTVSRKTAEDLIMDAVRYDPETGFIYRKITTSRSKAGDKTGTLAKTGYVVVRINDKLYYAHRLAILLAHGSWPDCQVDHINGDRQDNRLCNLRTCTQSQNMQNQRAAKSQSSSGMLGAHVDNKRGGWISQIKTGGTNKSLGRFGTASEAHNAYVECKRKMHEFCTI